MIRLFRVFVPTSLLVMLVSEAILVTTCFLAALFLTQPEEFEIILYYEGGILHISLMVAAFMLTMYFSDMYEETRTTSKIYLMQQLLMTIGVLFMSQALLAYGNRDLAMSRPVTLVGSVLLMIIIPAWRIAYSRYAFEVFGSEKILFLGSNAVVSAVAEHVTRHPELGYKGIGIIDDRLPIGDTLAGLPVIGIPADVERIAKENRPDCIVVGLTERRATLPVYALLELRFLGIIIEEAANTYERLFRRVPINGIRPSQLIFTSELGPQQSKMRLQMIYSWIIALAGCLVAAPIMIVVAILVRITSRGPVLFRQVRVGLNSEPFTVYKFRSMVVDAEAKTGAVWASRHDPRVTPIGRQLRRLRLDELPQLINVLRGEMAIVGPRPERPEFVTQLTGIIPFYRQRHAVRPGITGWAQINYKYGDTIEDTIMKLEYDLYYIKNLSPSLDFYIILHTLKVMLSSRSGQ